MLRRYLATGKRGKNRRPSGWRTTNRQFFRPVADCQNLARKYPKYSNWRTPAVRTPYGEYYGLIPMSIISTGRYWYWRGAKIPSPYADETAASVRGRSATLTSTPTLRRFLAQPSATFTMDSREVQFHLLQQRKLAFQRDGYTCTECGYKSQRGKGEVHDLEAHHIDRAAGDMLDNLQTLCLPVTTNEQLSS